MTIILETNGESARARTLCSFDARATNQSER